MQTAQPTAITFSAENKLQLASVTTSSGATSIFNYSHIGDIIVTSMQIVRGLYNIHAEKGEIRFSDGFSVVASADAELVAGLITSYTTHSPASIAKGPVSTFAEKKSALPGTINEKDLHQFTIYPSPHQGYY